MPSKCGCAPLVLQESLRRIYNKNVSEQNINEGKRPQLLNELLSTRIHLFKSI